MSQALHPMLNTAVKAARAAGSIINNAARDLDLVKVNTKAPNDFVTEVDQAAERAVIETLLGAYPGHGILAEESGSAHGAKDSDYLWIIDPLDGTTNFIHGMPYYAVSIALAFRGQLQQAVVYDPTRNDLFYASKGRGAFLNDKRIRVSKRLRMAESLVGTGFPFRKGDSFKRYIQMLEAVMPACAGLRRPGAAALDLCYVAAGALIITEAGGLIGNFTGEADYLYQREVVAGNPKIYGQLVQLLSPFTHVIKADDAGLATPASTAKAAQTPEEALAATQDASAAPSVHAAPAKKATRIRKADLAAKNDAPF